MELVKIQQCSLHYGEQVLMDNIDLSIHKGQKICLVGRNGTGKSTLLKLLSGEVQADSGTLWKRAGLRSAYLEQDLPIANSLTVYDVVASAFTEIGRHLIDFYHLSAQVAKQPQLLQQLEALQQKIEAEDGWQLQQRIEAVISRFGLDADATMDNLSGGWRRRVLLAKALVIDPELLLLDEPTNHLDIESIQWLEQQLESFQGAIVIISHDRQLLKKIGNRIVELDRGYLWSYSGGYQAFLSDKEKRLQEEARHQALFDKRLAEEESWIRQGIKARRTRNEGRVRRLEKMREDSRQRRQQIGRSEFTIEKGELSGKVVFDIEQLSFQWPESEQQWIIDNFSSRILRGDRIGIIGKNGAGKSTLIQLLLKTLSPSKGAITGGTKLSVAYFDQQRNQLELDKSAIDNVAGGREFISINGKDIHIISYLKDFLFTGERARTAVGTLSGGERNRILLAKLFSQPSNLLVLDEPTNDLDVETLELLEERLLDYQGTILLVSHDRAFLDNVVTNIIAFEEQGRVVNYAGGYSYWQQHFSHLSLKDNTPTSGDKPVCIQEKVLKKGNIAKKLSYQLQRELDELPEKIAEQECLLEKLNNFIAEEGFYDKDHEEITAVMTDLSQQQAVLEALYERWEVLESE